MVRPCADAGGGSRAPNLALDLIGQARSLYSYAAEVEGKARDEDDFAYLREERDWRNCLLVEQPNGDFAHTMLRHLLYSAFAHPYLEELSRSRRTRRWPPLPARR
jgi:ring-1,2-phenylacetyl-CoA epoxidase subunit PaaC